MTPFILVTLLAEVLGASGQASWGVSVVHNGQPRQVYYVNTDVNPYGPFVPMFIFGPQPGSGGAPVPGMGQHPPGVEINPDAEVFDPSAVKPVRPGGGRGVRRKPFGAKLKRHVKGYDQGKPQERKPLPPQAPEQPDEESAEPQPEPKSYSFEYSAEGQSRSEKSDDDGNIEGSYSYVGDDGVERRVDYKAGAGIGFVPTGAHLPVPPVPDYSGTPSVVNQNGIKGGGIKPSVSSHTPATKTKTPVTPKVPSYPEVGTHTPTYGVKTPVAPTQPGIKGKSDPSEEGCDEGKSDGPMDASYDFNYTNDDSERKEKSDANGNIEGSYWFVGDDGVRREIKYTAGAGKGFVVTGDIYPTGNAGAKGAVPKTKGSYPTQPPVNIPRPSVKNPQVPVNPQVPLPQVPSVKTPVPHPTPAYPQPTPGVKTPVSRPTPAYPQPTPGIKTKTPAYPSKPLPPQQPLPELPSPGTKSVPSNGCEDDNNEEPGDASYDFSYKTDDHEHSAKSDAAGNVQGSYSFTGPDGVLRRVDYVAGADTGFVATGDHLPKEGDFAAVDEGRRSDVPQQTPVDTQRPLPLPPQRPIPPQRPVQPQTPLPLPPQKPVRPQTPLPLPPQKPVQPHTPLPLPPQKPIHPQTPLPLPPQKPVHPQIPLPLPPQKPVHPQTPLPLPPQKPLPPQIPEEPRTPTQEPLEPDYPQVPVAPNVPQEPLEPDYPQVPVVPYVPQEPLYPDYPQVPVVPYIPSYPQVPLVPQVPVYPQIPLVPQEPLPDYPQRPIHIPDFPVDGQTPVDEGQIPVDEGQTPVHDGQTPVELTPQQPGCDDQSRDYDNSPADRSYSFDFAFDDQTRKEKSDSEGNVQGVYSFVGPDGVDRRVEYEAGPGIGFVAKGDHLPKPVEPLPLGPSEYVPPRSNGVGHRESFEPEGEFGNDPADSSYSFTYSTDSHSRIAADPHGKAKGTFLYVDDDGVEKKVDYQADKLAEYPAYGAHLPEDFRKAITDSGIAPPHFFSRYIFNTDSPNDGHLNEDAVFKYRPHKFSSHKGEEETDAPTAAPLVAKSELKSSQKPSYETFNKRGQLPLKSISQTGSTKGGYSYSYSSDDGIHDEAVDNFGKFKNNFAFVNDDGFEENDGFEKNFGTGYRRLNNKKADSKAPMAEALTNDLNKATEKVNEKDEKSPSKHNSYDPFSYFPTDDAGHDPLPPSGDSPPSPFLLPPRENFYMPNAMSFANRLYRRAQLKQRVNSHR